jgi:DNA primase
MDSLKIFSRLKEMGFPTPLGKSVDWDNLYEFAQKIKNDFKQSIPDLFDSSKDVPKDITGFSDALHNSINEYIKLTSTSLIYDD